MAQVYIKQSHHHALTVTGVNIKSPSSTHSKVPLAIAGAVTVRVGNELGAGNPLKAKRALYIGVVITCKDVM